MKIRAITSIGLSGATPPGGWAAELSPDDAIHTIVVVHTDEGVDGIGSAFTSGNLVAAAIDVLEPLWRGENALEPERVTETLHQSTFWLGRGGTLTHAISAIDIALWDILGKVTGQPVGRLLGGTYRERVTPYASLLMGDPADTADEIAALRERGFAAFKIGWGRFGRESPAYDEEIVRAARSAVGGGRLMVDAGASDAYWPNGLAWAKRTARMLADYDVSWFEEPLAPDLVTDFRQLRHESPVRIAGGEVLTRRQSYLPWLDDAALDVVQPDTTKVGGLSESRRIGWTAYDHGVQLIPHGWNTAVGLAADLQLAAALPLTDMVEYMTGSPYIDELLAEPWLLEADGTMLIPCGPGLGVRIDADALARVSSDARLH